MVSRLEALWGWFDARMPSLAEQWRIHASEYYAPKNFNFWYYFGSLALLVLVIQIVSGIFLTMNYKPDASLGVLHRRVSPHVPRPALRLVQAAARAGVDLRRADLSHPDGRGVLRLPAAVGPDVVLGRAGDRESLRHRAVHRAGPGAVDPRRLRGVRRHPQPLLRAARDRVPAGAARAGGGAPARARSE